MQTTTTARAPPIQFARPRRPAGVGRAGCILPSRAAEGVSRWPRAERVDWHNYSNEHNGWFISDAIHPTDTGAEAHVN
jgi:hypothetical protein